MATEDTEKLSWLHWPWEAVAALLLAVMTALGYGFAFVYEFAYAEHFGIPEELVRVDVMRILIALKYAGTAMVLAILSVIVAAVACVKFIPVLLHRANYTYGTTVERSLVTRRSWHAPDERELEKGLHPGDLSRQEMEDRRSAIREFQEGLRFRAALVARAVAVITFLVQFVGAPGLSLFYMYVFVRDAGASAARSQEVFGVVRPAGESARVVLRFYGEAAITAILVGTNMISGDFEVVPTSALKFRIERFGPLEVLSIPTAAVYTTETVSGTDALSCQTQ